MTDGLKIATGALATALMAWGAHAAGGGTAFIDRLQQQANMVVSGASGGTGVAVDFERAPLKRVALLSGEASEADRNAILAKVRAIPGIADARWVGDALPDPKAAAAPSAVEAPASAAVVADCQSDVNALMKGQSVQFRTGSAWIAPSSNALLDKLAGALKPCAGVSVEVQGHTDAVGNPASNQALSQARAEGVAQALTDRGVPAGRLIAKGFGSTVPVEQGTSPEANAANRRTVFAVSAAAAAPANPASAGGN